ncbi:MAG: phosphopyruvate hydratase [Clostridia bacterium]|nr:phosphopyruvate hydratase [Clostridia bacterium]
MGNCEIVSVAGFELIDSRGNPTTAARVVLADKSEGFAIAPSGASTGMYEAYELRDGDKRRYGGKGVRHAVDNINTKIANAIIGKKACNQREIDEAIIALDKSKNKSEIGANAMLSVSLAVAKAAAQSLGKPLYKYVSELFGSEALTLPRPMMNILNGGAHASNNIDIQEFMIVPVAQENFAEGLRVCAEIYHALGRLLKERNLACGVGDEGGFAPNLASDEEAIALICEAIMVAGYTTNEVKIALDVASSEWYQEGKYILPKRDVEKSAEQLIDYYRLLIDKYPIISIEDGVAEEDWSGWQKLTAELGNKIQLVGDDLFVTNVQRLKKGIELGAGNCILIKPNQIGTLTETLDVMLLAKQNGYKAVMSHRSGESEDSTIADLAVATAAGQIKTGAPCRSDRTAKYNRLLIIESEI